MVCMREKEQWRLILRSELEKREKIVLILDDVWKYIDQKKVGISLGVKGIKLMMTSSLKHVLEHMYYQPINMISVSPFSMNILMILVKFGSCFC